MPAANHGTGIKMRGIEIIRGHKWEAKYLKRKLWYNDRAFKMFYYYSKFKCTKCGIILGAYIDAGGTRLYCNGERVNSHKNLDEFKCQKRVIEQALR